MAASFACRIRQDQFEISRKLPQHLPTRATGRRRRLGWGDDNHAPERAVSFGKRLEHRDALGADGQAIRGVLDVAAGDDRPVGRFERSADFETGLISVRVLANGAGCLHQYVEFRIPSAEPRIPPGSIFRIPDPGSRIPA